LLQHRGAIWFKTLLQPKGHNSDTLRKSFFRLPSLSDVLDAMQSWLAPVIAFGLWLLLVTGTISRGWFTFCNFTLLGVWDSSFRLDCEATSCNTEACFSNSEARNRNGRRSTQKARIYQEDNSVAGVRLDGRGCE
jgi:hypothetical protein